jgi:hypothetical protein
LFRPSVYAAKRVEESTKPVIATANAAPLEPTEEQMKGKDADNVRVERTKNEDEDAMDVEPASVQPPLKETTAAQDAKENSSDHPVFTGGKDLEDSSHMHQDSTFEAQ